MRRATRPAAPRPSMTSSTRGSATLDELDLVAVGILDEGDDRGAEFHRARRARNLDPSLLQALAGGVDIGDADRQMTEGGADGVRLLLIPIVGELEHRAALLDAISDESEGIAALRHLALAQHFHAEKARVEIDRLLEVENAQHGVEKTRLADGGSGGSFSGGSRVHLSFSSWIRQLCGTRLDVPARACRNDREHDIGGPIAGPELAKAEAAKTLLAGGNLRLATGGIVKQAFDLLGNAVGLAILLNKLR